MRLRHLLMMLAICLLWAGNIVAIKESVSAVPPLTSVALRYAFMLPVCLPFLRFVEGLPADGRPPPCMVLVIASGLLLGASFGLGALSFHLATNVSALAIAGQLGVPFSLLLAIAFAGERIQWRRSLGILMSFAGVTILVFDPRIFDERLALLLTVISALLWAASTLLLRRAAGVHVLNLMGWQALVSLPLLLFAAALFEPGALAVLPETPLSAIGWILYSGFLSSLVGHAGMAWMLQRYPVSTITPLTLPTPLLAIMLATLWYRTPITLPMVLGAALTLTGVGIIALRTARKAAR
ncbi:DMT family transporter [Thermaurantiacus sp.]